MQILGMMTDEFFMNEPVNEINEFDAAIESIESTFAAQKLMDSYRAFKEADLGQIALDEVKKTLTTFVMHDLGIESNNETLAEVTASFGCRPEDLGLAGLEAEDSMEEPSRGRRVLNSIKSAGVAAKNGIKSGWNKVVETVKSWLGLNMIASQAFTQIEAKAGAAIEKLNAAQGSATLSDISVSGVDVNEFDGAIAHYKELVGALSKINKAKNGEASTIVNAIFGSLPKLLGIESNGEAELLSAAKQLKSKAKEKAVNVSHKITYAGPEGLKAVKNALTKLQKVAVAMKETDNYAELVSALKGMKKGLSSEDAAKLKVIVKVSSLYVKASSDVLRSLVKGVDNLLKVSKSFEKLTGKSNSKDPVAATESLDYASDVIRRLQGLSAGMESFGYETGFESYEDIPNEYANYEDGLESIMMMLDQFDDIEASNESFVDGAVMEAIAPQVAMLHAYAEDMGIEAADATFELMTNMSLGLEFDAGTEEANITRDPNKKYPTPAVVEGQSAKFKTETFNFKPKDKKLSASGIGEGKKSIWQKAKGKIKEFWEWLKNKIKSGWAKLVSKFRVLGVLETKIKNFSSYVSQKAKAAKEKATEWLLKIPGVKTLLDKIDGYMLFIKFKLACLQAFIKNPKKYLEDKRKYDALIKNLKSEDTMKKRYETEGLDIADMNYKSIVEASNALDFLSNELRSYKALADKLKVEKAFAQYKDVRDNAYGGEDLPDKTFIGNAIDGAFNLISKAENGLLNAIASVISTVKGWVGKGEKSEDKKPESEKSETKAEGAK